MTLRGESSVTKWVGATRSSSVPAVLAGFGPDDTPGIGTYYDYFDRLADGPYRRPCDHVTRESDSVRQRHVRSLPAEKEAKKKAAEDDLSPHQTKSEKLAEELLADAENPRPDNFRRILEDLLFFAGIIPSVEEGLLTHLENFAVSGDGSVLETAASPNGKPICSCRSGGIYNCECPRLYTSPTAVWCYDAAHNRYVFGDRYYHLVVTENGHDFPLLIVMPGGNESDYTLSLTAFDRLLKAAQENGADINVSYFMGDGHHDSYAHYNYFAEKDVIPVIPLSGNSKNAYSDPARNGDVRLSEDGTPICPGGMPMRRQGFDKNKNVNIFSCPVKRGTHRDGKYVYVTHEEECPLKKDCAPDSPAGPFVRIKPDDDPRLFPPLPRNTPKFKELANQRSASERCNFFYDACGVEGSSRSPVRSLIRLTFAGIAQHALNRHAERAKGLSDAEYFARTVAKLRAKAAAAPGFAKLCAKAATAHLN
ncbi:Uncharacterized protein dnm_025690 [Desulfonema magnum]|uniref:Transposase n=2 Tax=Desulfonema magnum TaxID=45655 RepID=A0A975BJY8_9BACT|nr:Uncharacterized protein dnm_025690 [Desulfonema magnum]